MWGFISEALRSVKSPTCSISFVIHSEATQTCKIMSDRYIWDNVKMRELYLLFLIFDSAAKYLVITF